MEFMIEAKENVGVTDSLGAFVCSKDGSLVHRTE